MKQNFAIDPYRNAVGLVWAKVTRELANKTDFQAYFPVQDTDLFWIQIAYVVGDEIYAMTELFDDDTIYALVLEASLKE